jgi:hypothetical protein
MEYDSYAKEDKRNEEWNKRIDYSIS